MRASIVTDAAGLAALEAAWWDLFARTTAATPFASPAWLIPWWEVFAPGDLFTVAVHEGDALVALAPLYIEDGPWGRRLLPLGIGLTDVLDILVDPAAPEAATKMLGQALRTVPGEVECWSAEDALPGAAVLAMPTPAGWTSILTPQSACPTLELATAVTLRDIIPARQWRKWQMARHRAARRSSSITLASPATVGDDLAHLFRLHAARWEQRGEPGVLADPAVRRFHAAAAPALLAAGLLRLTALWIDGSVAGVFYGLHRPGLAAAYLGGFDPAYAFESPGTLLIGDALEAAARDGTACFSFLRGQEAYKYAWGATDVWTQRRLLQPPR